MDNTAPTATRGWRRHQWLFGALALGIVAGGSWLLHGLREEWPSARVPAAAPPPANPQPAPAAVPDPRQSAEGTEGVTPEVPAVRELPYDGELLPEETLGNIECVMVPGWGAAAGTAVVALPHGAGVKFSVVDRHGTVFGDTVPFRANHYQVGRGEDGAPLVGLGALRRNSKRFQSPDSPEPARIYLGGKLIYETSKAWDFLIARDASSFAVHEPSGAGTSRLVVRDLTLGEERHFDLGTRLTPTNTHKQALSMSYTLDGKDVVVYQRTDATGMGSYGFYPVGGGRTQGTTIKEFFSALVVSRREAYFVETEAPGVRRITKRRLDARTDTVKELWHNVLDLRGGWLNGISSDGRYLGIRAQNFHVLNTENGQVVFQFPRSGAERQLAKLSSVLGPDASPSDVGNLINIAFRGNDMWFLRHFGSYDCSTSLGGKYDDLRMPPSAEHDNLRYRRCIRDHRERGLYKTVYDVYDLDTLTADSQPAYRTEFFQETSCMEGTMPLHGLQNVDGKLTYLTETQ